MYAGEASFRVVPCQGVICFVDEYVYAQGIPGRAWMAVLPRGSKDAPKSLTDNAMGSWGLYTYNEDRL